MFVLFFRSLFVSLKKNDTTLDLHTSKHLRTFMKSLLNVSLSSSDSIEFNDWMFNGRLIG